jgi:hypothetical protein
MAQLAPEAQGIVALFANGRGEAIPVETYEHYATKLRIIRLMFVELDEMVAEGDEVSDAEWAGWCPVWNNEMGELVKLVEAREAGELTYYQEVLLGDILTLLERERPRLTELKLANPAIPTREQQATGGSQR